MKALHIFRIIVSLGLVGCASQPATQTYPLSFQAPVGTLQAGTQQTYHWDTLAADVARRLRVALEQRNTEEVPLVLYVVRPEFNSPFTWAFHDLLVTQLIGQGFGVTRDPTAGLPLTYNVQTVSSRFSRGLDAVVVTTSVSSGDRYLARINDIYYINNFDRELYVAQVPPSTRFMEVVGP